MREKLETLLSEAGITEEECEELLFEDFATYPTGEPAKENLASILTLAIAHQDALCDELLRDDILPKTPDQRILYLLLFVMKNHGEERALRVLIRLVKDNGYAVECLASKSATVPNARRFLIEGMCEEDIDIAMRCGHVLCRLRFYGKVEPENLAYLLENRHRLHPAARKFSRLVLLHEAGK